MSEPADSNWLERVLQTRHQTKEQYYAWCDEMATSFMDFAVTLEACGYDEQAVSSQEIAKFFTTEMENILRHG